MAYKALGIPRREGITTNSGMTWKHLLATAGIVAASLWGVGQLMPTADAPPPTPVAPVDSDYEVRFYDSEGNLIDVPRRVP